MRGDEGAVAVVVAVALVALIGFTALVVDIGSLYEDRRRLQTAADAGALAGVQDLPSSPTKAKASAAVFSDRNYGRTSAKVIEIASTYVANDTCRVQLTDPAAPLHFASIWGRRSSPVRTKATAVVASPITYSRGVMPFGIMSHDPSETAPFGYAFEEDIMLKPGDGESGNYQFVALNEDSSREGSRFIYEAIANGGVPTEVSIGRDYCTKTGVNGSNVAASLATYMTCSHTFRDAVDVDKYAASGVVELLKPDGGTPCRRVVVVPIIINPAYPEGHPLRYNWTEVSGSKPVRVIGFVHLFVVAWGDSGSRCWIRGKFVRPVQDDALRYGPYSRWGSIHFRMID